MSGEFVLIYSYFLIEHRQNHPEIQEATVRIEDPSFDAVNHLPENWTLTDEWYNFDYAYDPPRSQLHVIATVDESTYSGGNNGLDHPIIWSHYFDGGRSFYTGLGHRKANWRDPDFVQHVVGGITWAGTEEEHSTSQTRPPANSKEPNYPPIPSPTSAPTNEPGPVPTKEPTYLPIPLPTTDPTDEPSPAQTNKPTYPTTISPTSGPLDGLIVVHAINAGAGEAYVSEDGISYEMDYGYSADNSGTYGSETEITGTNDDVLYQTERHTKSEFKGFSYSLSVVQGNTYRITLKLAELFWKADPAQYSGWERIFDILVEGEVAFDNINIFTRVGGLNKVYDLQYKYTATDSMLDIEFRKVKRAAKVNAILVEELPSSTPGLTNVPTNIPNRSPAPASSNGPTQLLTIAPTIGPNISPDNIPSNRPTYSPALKLTPEPTRLPTIEPTLGPNGSPAKTSGPTTSPSLNPAHRLNQSPTIAPTHGPTGTFANQLTTGPAKSPALKPTLDVHSPAMSKEENCKGLLATDHSNFDKLGCINVVFLKDLCMSQAPDVEAYAPGTCIEYDEVLPVESAEKSSNSGDGSSVGAETDQEDLSNKSGNSNEAAKDKDQEDLIHNNGEMATVTIQTDQEGLSNNSAVAAFHFMHITPWLGWLVVVMRIF